MVSRLKPAIFSYSFSLLPMIRFIICLCLFTVLSAGTSAAATRPNIILIMADDMGYEALSANGSESCKSPNLDKLAEKACASPTVFLIRSARPPE